ncbi:MAG: SIS domain-containing protein [Bacillota bacterium]
MSVLSLIQEHLAVVQALSLRNEEAINTFARECRKALESGNTIFFMGNGGSAADSQHLAAELVGRFQKERKAMAAVALTTDTSIITSVGNDYGFESIFYRQVEALVKKGDVVVGISTSGNSPNVLKAIAKAKEEGAYTIGMTGENGGTLNSICDLCIKVPSKVTARIQEAHILIGHIICELIEEA